jgi:hypothetical protein
MHDLPAELYKNLTIGSKVDRVKRHTERKMIDSCDGMRLLSQHCGLGPVVLSPRSNYSSRKKSRLRSRC